MTDDQKLQEKYVMYQLLAQRLETLKQEMVLAEQQVLEIRSTLSSVEDMKKMNDKNEILLPLGSGCYGSGKITDSRSVLVNIGSGIFLNKSTEKAGEFLEERAEEIRKAGKQIEEQAENIAAQMNHLAEEMQELAEKHETRKS
jgi:prefoldin alpha subunit